VSRRRSCKGIVEIAFAKESLLRYERRLKE
jgi:hypothetical protein